MLLRDDVFCENLRRLRNESGLSQYELEKEMNFRGSTISRSTYAKIERGERNLKVHDLVILQDIYGVDYSEFFVGIKIEKREK
ncbi:MAG: helix-turn-helix domain-containing protein [[Clostridium] scindens]